MRIPIKRGITFTDSTAEIAENAEIRYFFLRALCVLCGKIRNCFVPRLQKRAFEDAEDAENRYLER